MQQLRPGTKQTNKCVCERERERERERRETEKMPGMIHNKILTLSLAD